jgi:hypothetical protein
MSHFQMAPSFESVAGQRSTINAWDSHTARAGQQIFSCMTPARRVHSQLPVRPGDATGNFLRGVLRSTKNEHERTWTCCAADSVDHFWI